jgi:anhydro-N-acetylmuramic acid kinase
MAAMTSPIAFPANVIGLMSGTSADGVDAAMLRTDGQELVEPHESVFVPYSDGLRRDILALMRGEGDKQAVAHALTLVHIEAVQELLKKTKLPAHAVGFHGQTIRHAPDEGITEQIGDAALMAKTLGIPVVADFRTNDVRHGGQGAPLVPLYHAAICAKLGKPVMVVNIGGVSNVTWIGEGADDYRRVAFHGEPEQSDHQILAFDCGPGNALLDDWVHRYKGARFDKDGELAGHGAVHQQLLAQWMSDPFFAAVPPKSLDRNHFHGIIPSLIQNVMDRGGAKANRDDAVADGAATLAAFTVEAIAKAVELSPSAPKQLLVTGGGRHNPTLMRMLAERVACDVAPVEAVGFNGDMLEAEAFAYLAARSILGLPLSLPTTTGVDQPVTGGVFYPV